MNTPPSVSKITCKYLFVDLYSGVVFVFCQKRIRVRVKNTVRVRVRIRIGFRFGFGFDV